MSKNTPDLKTHVASTHTAAFLALIKCSYVEADPALLCKNLPNFMGGSGTTLKDLLHLLHGQPVGDPAHSPEHC